jgi:hypothetical protein
MIKLLALLVTGLALASCAAATESSSLPAAGTAAASPSQSSAAASAVPPVLIGTWTRTQGCEGQLAAFVEAGLIPSYADWITGNWVGDPAEVDVDPDDLCAGARPDEEHSHFFTEDGRFGSYDAAGEQVDDGDFAVVDADTLSFPSHSAEFGYDGDILVTYAVSGDSATFEVQVPSGCEDACLLAHAWALSAFYGPDPWSRTE